MGKGYKHGGSGGAALNFNVKTYPSETELKADKPRENTIGVITTTTMTSWVFSATEPTELEVGMVWIAVGSSSNVDFNALKQNTLQVYPLSAKQYVGGELTDVVAMIYQGVEWENLYSPPVLYDYGKENTDVLGENGFRLRSGGTGVIDKGDSYFTVMAKDTSSLAMATHDKKIDVTYANKLKAIVYNREPNTGYYMFYGIGVIVPEQESSGDEAFIASTKVTTSGEQTLTVDLSNVSGNVKVAIVAQNYYMPVYKVWFE